MKIFRSITHPIAGVAAALAAGGALAHPGHGALEGHYHGVAELVVLLVAAGIAYWLLRSKR